MAKESSYSALELRALAAAGASLASELSLEAVLQKVADLACEQVGARYGALSVFDEHGAVRQFITSGISDEDRARIGEPPEGKGLLGVMLREGTSIRVNDLSSDPRGAGFPLNHPEMRSLLGVPVAWAGQVIGNLYLADKEKGSFTDRDEEIVTLFSTQAAIAIRNAQLYEEEKRRAKEWKELFDLGREVTGESARLHSLLESVAGRARRLLGTDVALIMLLSDDAESLEMAAHAGLRTEGMRKLQLLSEDGLQGLALETLEPVVVTDYETDKRLKNRPLKLVRAEGLVSQICVPLRGKGGAIGTITVGNRARTDFSSRERELLEALANWMAVAIETNRLQAQLESLARLEERDRIAMDLHDGVIQSIYAVGLQLEDIAEDVDGSSESARDRLEMTINSLNSVIKDIRSYIFDLRPSASSVDDLPTAIEGLARGLRVNTLIGTEVDVELEPDLVLSGGQALGLYHIAQEALNNIGKHSQASTANVLLKGDRRSLRLEISDNGRGFAEEATDEHSGQGIRNMKDRAKSLGASIVFDSGAKGGTTIRVVMPLDARAGQQDG